MRKSAVGEERGGGLVEEEGAGADLEEDLGARLGGGVVGSHESFPRGGRGERVDECWVGGFAEPRPPGAASFEATREVVTAAVFPEKPLGLHRRSHRRWNSDQIEARVATGLTMGGVTVILTSD